MRVLQFKVTENSKLYGLIYNGMVETQRTFTEKEVRIVSRIMDKLEEYGTPVGDAPPDRATFALTEDGAVILEEAEFALLRDALKHVPWTTRGARVATMMFEWLDNVKETKAAQVVNAAG